MKSDLYAPPGELVLGIKLNAHVPDADQIRQRHEVEEILRRMREQPGVVLADEVGMGKTFVALAIAYSVAVRSPRGPVVLMVPANLVDKWVQDLKTFCELYVEGRRPVQRDTAIPKELTRRAALRFGVARHSVELMKLLDDGARVRCHLVFLAQGAMGRRQTDKWLRLALIAEALRRHGRGKAGRLIKVKRQIHRFLAELLWARGEQRAHDLGQELWQHLLRTDPARWKDIYNAAVQNERRLLLDDPVPKSVVRALHRIELQPLAASLEKMPIRARGGDTRISERLTSARKALRLVEQELWSSLLAQSRWRSPLLVMDEAHHLKNPGTLLARQLQSPDSDRDLRTGDGAMANAFDRMLFLTATPFQLGHHELVRVLERFGDVRWDSRAFGDRKQFIMRIENLGHRLNESQRTAIALQRCWSRLRPEDCGGDVDAWWERMLGSPRESLTIHQRPVIDAYQAARRSRELAQQALQPWIVRHDKGELWAGTNIPRRHRADGAAILEQSAKGGLPIPPQQLLPFFLAARSTATPGQDLLGEALSSSYEAFRLTRQNRAVAKDDQETSSEVKADLTQSIWYLTEFDRALESCSGSTHPKIHATVKRAADLWEAGEKVLVFAFYRHTCRALRLHISSEIEQRITATGLRRLGDVGQSLGPAELQQIVNRVQKRFFDDTDSPGRKALDAALNGIVDSHRNSLNEAEVPGTDREGLIAIMRRFLRVTTTLVRCFPLDRVEAMKFSTAVEETLGCTDGSGVSWRQKFDEFIGFLTSRCSSEERRLYLEALARTQTGGIRVAAGETEEPDAEDSSGVVTLANVQVATGETRRDARTRLMRAFNTPFFPDILVCSQVMGEGVDLQRFCRHVIHHDLDWNPSTIEQRTGRIDRLACKAEGQQPIVVYLPYLSGTADERQYRVMSDREQWFRIVMGQDEVARLITSEFSTPVPLPNAISTDLSFHLGLKDRGRKALGR